MTTPDSRVRPLMFAALLVPMAAAMLASPAAPAAAARSLGAPAMLVQASPSVTPDAAAQRVRAVSGGRILDVRLEGSVYRVKVLLDGGRVRIYRVNADTGRVIQ